MRILAVGAHPDDIELYAGGALLRHIDNGDTVRCIVCSHGESQKIEDDRVREQQKAWEFMNVKDGILLGLPDGRITHGTELTGILDRNIKEFKPDIVYSHSEHDHHQDHIAVAKCVRSANRTWNFQWFTYCSYDLRNSFQPNYFINLDNYFKRKMELLKCFKSQKARWYMREDVLISKSLGTNIGKYVEPFRMEFGYIK